MLNEAPIAPRAGRINLLGVLIFFLAVGAIVFGGLAVYAFGKAQTATSTLEAQKQAAASAAAKQQAEADKKANEAANESPYQTYTAPSADGRFKVSYPKNWSAQITQDDTGLDQLVINLNPDYVSVTGNQTDPLAAIVTLENRQYNDEINDLTNANSSDLKLSKTTVSGITGTNVTGTFDDNVTVRAVYLPVRDKTLIISTQRAAYSDEFNQILSDLKVNP